METLIGRGCWMDGKSGEEVEGNMVDEMNGKEGKDEKVRWKKRWL